MRRHKQQEFSFQSFHVRLMYVDCLFLFIIAITVILGGAHLFHARLRGRPIWIYFEQPRSQGSLLPVPMEREREERPWLGLVTWFRNKLILRVGERPWKRGCVLNSRMCD